VGYGACLRAPLLNLGHGGTSLGAIAFASALSMVILHTLQHHANHGLTTYSTIRT
jgi:hypothetical protein